ncbi:MAG: ribonuclease BN (tRNA processing enzyme) [Candidatus Aldehydirespiratoraceae bacterium]|jgi:ribonuclease BN (tRNA processing enzyme)
MVSTLSITILGSSGSYASPTNPCTGFLLQSRDATVLYDCGPGTVGPLQAAIELDELDAIVTSHCHPDHWLELPVLRNVFTWFHPRTGIAVYGTAQTRKMDSDLHIAVEGAPSPFEWTVINNTSELVIGDQHWTFVRTDHPVETLAARVEVDGKIAFFTSDSGPNFRYDDFAARADIVFSDASHLAAFEGESIPHMSARESAERATSAEVKHLVLTHLVPGCDPVAHREEAVGAYGGPVDVALSGDVFEI